MQVGPLKFTSKQGLGIVIAAIIVIIGFFLPPVEGLSHKGIVALAILFGAVAMWICNSLPAGVTGLIAMAMYPLLGVATVPETTAGFGSTVVVFAIVIFAITAVVMKTKIGERLIGVLLRWAGASSSKLVLAFMIGSALLSTIMSNTPVVVLFMGFANIILQATKAEAGKSNLGKCLMIGIPVATIAGGFATPVGSSFNVMALGMLESMTGETIGFLQWMAAGIPIAVVTTFVAWFSLTRILKPEPITEEQFSKLTEQTSDIGKFNVYEKKALVIIGAMLLCWILGSWFPALNLIVVALVGFAIMFVPGINMLTFDEFQKSVPWNVVLMLAAIMCIGNILAATGGAAFIAKLFLSSGVMTLGVFLSLLCITAFAYFLHTVVPVGPAILGVFIAPAIALCASFDMTSSVPTIILAGVVAGNFLLPINPLVMFTYNGGYYSFVDMIKSGILPTIVFILALVLWVPFICGAMGF